MQTFDLNKEELIDLNAHKYLMERYIVLIVCKRIGVDIAKNDVKYDLNKGEIYIEEQRTAAEGKPMPAPGVVKNEKSNDNQKK
jgi:hypothetical protein